MRSPIGLTGGIATGKSTFARMLARELDAGLFCADACVRELLETDAAVAGEIRALVHPGAYRADGSPDRALLRALIFSDPAHKAALEAILHPRVRAAWTTQAAACRAAGRPFLADIPLLFEVGAAALFASVIAVACSDAIRLPRLLARPGIDEATAKKMIASQAPLDTKIEQSHHVVWNDGPLHALALQAAFLASLFDARPG